jgi:DNA-binding MarR family transcriptional regulator
MPAPASLQLLDFIPFRLNRLASEISQRLSEIYRERFGLDIPEWRILATLGAHRYCTAQYVADSTRMHKTRVSRAAAQLAGRGLLRRSHSAADGREVLLRLTPKGRRLYAELVPLALRREKELMACLAPAQADALLQGLAVLERSLGLPQGATLEP